MGKTIKWEKLSKNSSLLQISLLLILNLAFRFPNTPHELGADSFLLHGMSNSISTSGSIQWVISNFSIFGLYPFSYPPGSPIILSIFSQVTALSMENTIYMYCIVLTVLGVFASYSMALRLNRDLFFAFITAFAFSTAPVFIELTRWSASSRNQFLALFPLILWAFFWFNERGQIVTKQALVIIILFVTLCTTHRLYFLLSFLIISYLLTCVLFYFKKSGYILKYIEIITNERKYNILLILTLLAFLLQFSGLSFYRPIWYDYMSGAFAKGTNPLILLLNLSTNYIGNIGILLLLAVFGYVLLIKENNETFNGLFMSFILIESASILALGTYAAPFLLPFFSLLIGLSLIRIKDCSISSCKNGHDPSHKLKLTRRWNESLNLVPIIIALLLICSIIFSGYMINRHMYSTLGDTSNRQWADNDVLCLGQFLKNSGVNVIIASDLLTGRRIYAYSSIPDFFGDYLILPLIAHWVNKDELNVKLISISSLNPNVDNLFYLAKDPTYLKDFIKVYNSTLQADVSRRILGIYNIKYMIIDNNLLNKNHISDFEEIPSNSIKGVNNCGKKIYDNKRQSVWSI